VSVRGEDLPKTTTWELDPHSRAKHLLLRKYLEVWYAKLASTSSARGGGQLNYIDAFAGPGIYERGEPGSPIVALTTLLNHIGFARWRNVRFLFYFVEADFSRYESLCEQINAVWAARSGGRPANVRVITKHASFYDAIEELSKISEAKGQPFQVPTFAFVDPFGFKEIPVAKLCSLLRNDRCEVLFNFMYDAVNHWATAPNEKNQEHMRLLLGGDEHLDVEGLAPGDRERILHEIFERMFHEHGNFQYVRRFQMEGLKARTLYSLYFATHSIVGLEVMKDVMWKIDPAEGRRFSDRLVDQPSLFEGQPNYEELKRLVLLRLATSKMAIKELENFVTTGTDFKSSHLKTNVLKPLEHEGQIVVTSTNPQRRKGTFADGCTFALAEKAS
jgi:three-Cys-motif partner protein